MTLRDRRVLLISAALASVLVLMTGVAGHEDIVAYAGPLLILVLPLVAGRYLGEERIARVAGQLGRRRRRPPEALRPRLSSRVAVLVPRGGRLIASALAKRPPPVSALS